MSGRIHSLDNVNLLHHRVAHVSTVKGVGQAIEAASKRIAEPVCTDLGQDVGRTFVAERRVNGTA